MNNAALKSLISFVLVLFVPMAAWSYVDLNAFYFTDSFKTSSTATNSSMFVEASVGLSIDKKKTYLIGWNYSSIANTTKTTSTQKYSSTQMGPRFVWRIGKAQNWSLGVGYNLITKAKYDDGSGSAFKWTGTAIKADFGYSFDLSEDVQFGVRLNYSSASYKEQLTAADVYSKITTNRTFMYPTVYLIWLW